MTTYTKKFESGRAKYIFVWVLASALMTIITFIPDRLASYAIEGIGRYVSFQAAYAMVNGAIGILSVLILLGVYSVFSNVFIKRAMPYYWVAGALGFLFTAGNSLNALGQLYVVSGMVYIDLATQFVCVFMIYWIPATFAPRQYNPPSGRNQYITDYTNQRAENAIVQPRGLEGIRREPPLTAQSRKSVE